MSEHCVSWTSISWIANIFTLVHVFFRVAQTWFTHLLIYLYLSLHEWCLQILHWIDRALHQCAHIKFIWYITCCSILTYSNVFSCLCSCLKSGETEKLFNYCGKLLAKESNWQLLDVWQTVTWLTKWFCHIVTVIQLLTSVTVGKRYNECKM